ncbi:MAG: LytTR family DNA-binding domain-containing protein [Saprospiraceae bacterium]
MSSIWQQRLRPNTPRDFYRGMFVLGVTVVLILVLFQPFGTAAFQHTAKYVFLAGYGLAIVVAAIIYYETVSRMAPRWLDHRPWTLGREIGFLLPLVIFCISATWLYRWAMLGGTLSLYGYLYYLGIALATSIFPLALVLTARIMGSQAWLARVALEQHQEDMPETLTLHGENQSEQITCYLAELMYIQAADNYAEIHLAKSGGTQRHVLRASLKDLEDQLSDRPFLRVHRSFLVNLANVAELEGRSPAYQLRLYQMDTRIPVSRSKVSAIRHFLASRPV